MGLGKTNGVFGRLERIWLSKKISTAVKIRFTYESLFLSILLTGAEIWSMKQESTKKLEIAHNRWIRKIVHISWKIREDTQQEKMDSLFDYCLTTYRQYLGSSEKGG